MSARWYKRCGADFIHGTMMLSLEEKGAYSLCLDLIYDRGGPIPDDARWLSGVCGVSIRKWNSIRERLIQLGKIEADNGFITNARAAVELVSAELSSRERAESGAKGGRKRAENAGHAPKNNDLDEAELKREEKIRGEEKKVVARKRARTTDFEIPDWVPAEPWAAFCAMRQRKKATVDSYIADRLFAKLQKIAAAGWDLAKVLDKATLNNWTDLYMPTAGRDDELRAAVPHQGQGADPEEFRAFCLRSAERSRQMGREQEAVDWEAKARGDEPRRSGTGPPRAIGTLLNFPQQATH